MHSHTEIARKFRHKDEKRPVAYDVGGLIEILKELPDTLPVKGSIGDRGGVQLAVFNYGKPGCHVEIEEVDDEEEHNDEGG